MITQHFKFRFVQIKTLLEDLVSQLAGNPPSDNLNDLLDTLRFGKYT